MIYPPPLWFEPTCVHEKRTVNRLLVSGFPEFTQYAHEKGGDVDCRRGNCDWKKNKTSSKRKEENW
jgi:hypothetical protein